MNLLMTAMMRVIKTDPYWRFPPLHLNSKEKVVEGFILAFTYLSPEQQHVITDVKPRLVVVHPVSNVIGNSTVLS